MADIFPVSAETAIHILFGILVIDLEYQNQPPREAPLRHKFAWMYCKELLGEDVFEKHLQEMITDIENGDTFAIKTNPVLESERQI